MEMFLCFKRLFCVSGVDIFRITHSSRPDKSAKDIVLKRETESPVIFQHGYCRPETFSITGEYIFPKLKSAMRL